MRLSGPLDCKYKCTAYSDTAIRYFLYTVIVTSCIQWYNYSSLPKVQWYSYSSLPEVQLCIYSSLPEVQWYSYSSLPEVQWYSYCHFLKYSDTAIRHFLKYSDIAIRHFLQYSDTAIHHFLKYSDTAIRHFLQYSDTAIRHFLKYSPPFRQWQELKCSEIPNFLCKPNIQYSLHNCSPLQPSLNQIIPSTSPKYTYYINLNIILQFTLHTPQTHTHTHTHTILCLHCSYTAQWTMS